jgi:DNA-binding FadR family transcriptional regulator
MIDADMAFHEAIYAASGNPLIGQTALQHWRHLRRVMGAVLQRGTPARSRLGRARGHRPGHWRGRCRHRRAAD